MVKIGLGGRKNCVWSCMFPQRIVGKTISVDIRLALVCRARGVVFVFPLPFGCRV